MNRNIKNRLGDFNVYGDPIQIPLTETTVPAVSEDLKQIANDLVEGKFRLKTTNDEVLWQEAQRELAEFIDRNYGWVENRGFRVQPAITITPLFGAPSTVVTIGGTQFAINQVVTILVGKLTVDTIPTTVVADSVGAFSGVTFTISSTATSPGSEEIVVFSAGISETNSQAVPPRVKTRFRVT